MREDARVAPDARLDRALFGAFAFEPSAEAVALVDRRVRAAIETTFRRADRGAEAGFRARLRARFSRTSRLERVAGVLVAVVVLSAAGRGIVATYEAMVGSDGGWRTAWDHAAVLGISQTVDGYRVTIERAYADANQLMLAVSVYDDGARGWTQVGATGVEATDEQGRPFQQSMGLSGPDGSASAADIMWFAAPAGLSAGRHTITVTVPSISVRDDTTPPPDASPVTVKGGDSWSPWHDVAGPWTFTIPLEVAGGAVARPDSAVRVGATEVRLARVSVSPTSVDATISVAGGGPDGGWAPVGQFVHRGHVYPIDMSSRAAGGGTIMLRASDGTTDTSGDWTLRIDELVGNDATGQVRLAGPWELSFSMP